jgi:hypothetical protein
VEATSGDRGLGIYCTKDLNAGKGIWKPYCQDTGELENMLDAPNSFNMWHRSTISKLLGI